MEHPKSIEHRSGFEAFSGTRHLLLAALARNEEHMGRTFDVGRVLGFLWNDCSTPHRPPLCLLHRKPIYLARRTSTDPYPILMQSPMRIRSPIPAIVAMRVDSRPAMQETGASPELRGHGET